MDNKDTKKVKEDIAKKLRLSDKTLWNESSEEQRQQAVETYYNIGNIEETGLSEYIQRHRDTVRNSYSIIVSAIIGALGGNIANMISKGIDEKGAWPSKGEIFILFIFVIVIIALLKVARDVQISNFKEDKVLHRLLSMQNKTQTTKPEDNVQKE